MDVKIFKISAWIDEGGFAKSIYELSLYRETNKAFVCEGSRISKSKLMKIDTMYRENHKSIRYYTYCKDGDQQKALDLIKSHIMEKIKTYKSEIDILFKIAIGD